MLTIDIVKCYMYYLLKYNILEYTVMYLFLAFLCIRFQSSQYDSLKCHIEGGPPLTLTLTGVCIEQTPLKEVCQHILYTCYYFSLSLSLDSSFYN